MAAQAKLPGTMLAYQNHATKPGLHETRIPVPAPGDNEILVRILAAGVCHSDLTILARPGLTNAPVTLGHEGCGEIVALGPGAEASWHHLHLAVGDRVSLHGVPGCQGEGCKECKRGLHRMCTVHGLYGLNQPGFFAEYAVVKAWAAVRVPEVVSNEQAAVAPDAVLTAYHAVTAQGQVNKDSTVVVYGLGGVGMNALQTVLHLGAKRVLVVERRREVLDEVIKLGVRSEDAMSKCDELAKRVAKDGLAIDVTLDFVGNVETFTSAQNLLRPGGTLVLVGISGQELPFNALPAIMKGIQIRCSYNGTFDELKECLDLIAQGKLTPQISTKPLDQVNSVLVDLHDGKIMGRMVLQPRAKEA